MVNSAFNALDIKPICRVCLASDDVHLVKLFQNHNDLLLSDKINYVTSINASEEDGLPDTICEPCIQSLNAAFNFKKKCEDSNVALRLWIKTHRENFLENISKNSIKEEPYLNVEQGEISSPVVFSDGNIAEEEHEDSKYDVNEGKPEDYNNSEGSISITETCKSKPIVLNLECHDCGNLFSTKCKLRVHWKKEHLPSKLICPNCMREFKSYKSLNSHIKKRQLNCLNASKFKIIGTGKSRMYCCFECDYKSTKVSAMMTHSVLHTGEKPFACEICGKAFTQLGSLLSHQDMVHNIKVKEYICPECGKHVAGRINMVKHKQSHMTSHPCSVCNKVLKSKVSLKQHMHTHSGVKRHKCDLCPMTFYTRGNLCNHKHNQHTKTRIYKCDRCEFTSRYHTGLTRHKNRHTDNNVCCYTCGKFFPNLDLLDKHEKRHEESVSCEYCDKAFLNLKNLLRHHKYTHNIKKETTVNNKSEKNINESSSQS